MAHGAEAAHSQDCPGNAAPLDPEAWTLLHGNPYTDAAA
jgi:hypothetical protein